MNALYFCALPFWQRTFFALICCQLLACGGTSETHFALTTRSDYNWGLDATRALPVEPRNNPMTEARFQLGRHLFYDEALSGNGTQSCASCHIQTRGFSDGFARPTGSTGDSLARNSQGLLNVAYNATLTWANTSLLTLEDQALVPLFGEDPVEQGIHDGNEDAVLDTLRNNPVYPELFSEAFPKDGDPIHMSSVVLAVASFVRGMVSFDTPFDHYLAGEDEALSGAEKRGMALFFSEELDCFHCHGGYNFSDSTIDRTMNPAFVERPFHNTGLFNIGGTGDYPADNTGIFHLTGVPAHMGKFRAPTLRNIAVTAPYMHDGSMASLSEVIDFYAAGGRNITTGPNQGDGRDNPFKDSLINGFTLGPGDKQDLIAFLESLTDASFNTNPRFSDPLE